MLRKIKCILFLVFLSYNFSLAQTWHAVGNGVGSSSIYYFSVYCTKVINNVLYVGGDFRTEFGAAGDGIVKFDGSNWNSLNCSFGMVPNSMDIFTDNKIYFGGGFTDVCYDNSFRFISRWSGINWEKYSIDMPNSIVNTIATYKNELFIGGEFSSIGSMNAKRIARWDGSSWHDVGGGVWDPMPYSVHTMAVYNGELIVGGLFSKAGTDTVNNIAAWDGVQWHALGNGVNTMVWTLFTDTISNLLYAGGNFTYADDTIPVKYIACWDGQRWSALKDSSNGFNGIPGIFAITRFNNKIYVGGTNTTADTILVRWDGMNWENVQGISGNVNALSVYKGNLYVGGGFTSINGDTSIKYIACYGDSCPLNVGIHEIKTDKKEYLWQNIPNPFNTTTTIPYYVPNGYKGSIQIVDANGKLIKEYALLQGKNNLDISMENLKSGTYFYWIVIDGRIKQTKKMSLE